MKSFYRALGLLVFGLFFTSYAFAQSIGTWQAYLNYTQAQDVDILGSRIFTATKNSIFILDTLDNSVSTLNRVKGLSDVGNISNRANREMNVVIVGYSNGNMDLIKGSSITNYSAIKNSDVVGDKGIKHISFLANTAFISTGVGILEFDIERIEVRDSYSIIAAGSIAINETAILDNVLFAATDQGLFMGSITSDLTIFSNWSQDLSIPNPFDNVANITSHGGKIYANLRNQPFPGLYLRSDQDNWNNIAGTPDIRDVRSSPGGLVFTLGYTTILKADDGVTSAIDFNNYGNVGAFPISMVVDGNGVMWLSDRKNGLVKRNVNGSFEFIKPGGPASNGAFDLDFDNGQLWVATGALSRPGNWDNQYLLSGFYRYNADGWLNFDPETYPVLFDKLFFDNGKIYADPDNPEKAYAGSFYAGLVEIEGDALNTFYYADNSSLSEGAGAVRDDDQPWVGVAGIVKDNDDNLWVSNSRAETPLAVQTPEGVWRSFDLIGQNGLQSNKLLLDMMIDQNDQKWVIVNKGGIVVFDENGTIEDESDDKVRLLGAGSGNGGLPSNEVFAITEDLDGEIWVGSTEGIAVFYSPFDVLEDDFSDARQILVEQDGVFQFLLEGQSVSAIAIDGANRKWIGTFGAGLFLLSEDGTEQVRRFTVENSPLLSDNINDIVIDPKTGEVFIATQEGIVSYISDATAGQLTNECAMVYPNPVRETYTGAISISGLARDSEVRITDVRGNLIYRTVSFGGKAIWDGKNTNGERVATGVYFALSADVEGGSTCVSKILVVK